MPDVTISRTLLTKCREMIAEIDAPLGKENSNS